MYAQKSPKKTTYIYVNFEKWKSADSCDMQMGKRNPSDQLTELRGQTFGAWRKCN